MHEFFLLFLHPNALDYVIDLYSKCSGFGWFHWKCIFYMFVFDLTDTNSILSAIINLVIIQHMNTDAHTHPHTHTHFNRQNRHSIRPMHLVIKRFQSTGTPFNGFNAFNLLRNSHYSAFYSFNRSKSNSKLSIVLLHCSDRRLS